MKHQCRNLVIILGDQLDSKSSAFDGFDKQNDVVWMAEVDEESTYVWNHKARIAIFLAAMRHFRDGLKKRKFPIEYQCLDATDGGLADVLSDSIESLQPEKLVVLF